MKKEDILSRFLEERNKDPENMTDKYLRDIILNFLIAGKDTTAGTLSWFIYMLCKHPLVQERVYQDIIDATEAGEKANFTEFSQSITDEVLSKMHYLHAYIYITMINFEYLLKLLCFRTPKYVFLMIFCLMGLV